MGFLKPLDLNFSAQIQQFHQPEWLALNSDDITHKI